MTQAKTTITIDELPHQTFDAIIDTRSPAEYADDHIPGAINCPVLSDAERAQVGTIYKQVSPFEARKLGATLTARNIARAIEQHFMDKPKNWRPLIYCWRGGQRSGAMQIVMREIGWPAMKIDGGYKAYRTQVLHKLDTLPAMFRYVVIAGPTGSGKTRLLHALRDAGAQVLDLEAMAGHKGSVLGRHPDEAQNSRKSFDTALVAALSSFDAIRPVFVESESRRIGIVHLPESLVNAMRAARCVVIQPTLAARVDFLVRDYDYFCADPHALMHRLSLLKELQGKETIDRWHTYVSASQWDQLVHELLARHYDPLYTRSIAKDYPGIAGAMKITPDILNDVTFAQMARDIMTSFER